MTCAKTLLAFAVVVGIVAVPLSAVDAQAAPAANPSVTDADLTRALAVELVPAASGILRPGDDLTVSVTLSNRSDDTVAAATAQLYLWPGAVENHLDLSDWITHESSSEATGATSATGASSTGTLIAEVPTPILESGQSVVLPAIVVPAAAVVVENPAAFGAHQLEARVDSGTGGVVGARSSITFDPGVGGPFASIATVMPITVSGDTVGLLPAVELDRLTGPGGTLARELEQADGRAIALAIDPRIILSIRALGSSAPANATAWLSRLARVPNVTFPLSYADSDVAATSQLGAGILTPLPFALDPTLFPATPEGEPSEEPTAPVTPSPPATPVDPSAIELPTIDDLLAWDYTRDDIVWPRELSVVAADLDTFAAAGDGTTILTSTNVTVAGGDSAPSPVVRLGGNEALVSDAVLSALFREAVTATTTPQWESAIVRLTAALAAIAGEGAGEGGGPDAGEGQLAVASLTRDSAAGSFRLAETLDAITANPWSSGTSLTSALSGQRLVATLLATPTDPLRMQQFQNLLASETQTTGFASVLADPSVVTGERRLALLAMSSQSWAATDADWTVAVGNHLTRSGDIVASVQVDTTGTITVLADNGDLPISVSNVLDYPVTVYVTVISSRLLLAVRETRVPVTIEANSQKRASIPVQSLANGEVTISIVLTSATGIAIGQTAFAQVTVQAGWETVATSILGVLVGLVFIAGIVRTVRRQRRGRGFISDAGGSVPADASVDRKPDAVSKSTDE